MFSFSSPSDHHESQDNHQTPPTALRLHSLQAYNGVGIDTSTRQNIRHLPRLPVPAYHVLLNLLPKLVQHIQGNCPDRHDVLSRELDDRTLYTNRTKCFARLDDVMAETQTKSVVHPQWISQCSLHWMPQLRSMVMYNESWFLPRLGSS